MSNGWHKCFLCDCEFYDESISGYWGWCRDCRKVAFKEYPQKETQKETQKENPERKQDNGQ